MLTVLAVLTIILLTILTVSTLLTILTVAVLLTMLTMLEKKLFLDPVILNQTKRFRFQDRKFMLKYKLSIPSRNLCQVVVT